MTSDLCVVCMIKKSSFTLLKRKIYILVMLYFLFRTGTAIPIDGGWSAQ
jgi:hypothetical protein